MTSNNSTNKPLLLEFFLEWCHACKIQDPILEELRSSIGDKADIIKINVNENKDVADAWRIDATPTLFVVKNYNILNKYVGVTSRAELESAINNAIISNSS